MVTLWGWQGIQIQEASNGYGTCQDQNCWRLFRLKLLEVVQTETAGGCSDRNCWRLFRESFVYLRWWPCGVDRAFKSQKQVMDMVLATTETAGGFSGRVLFTWGGDPVELTGHSNPRSKWWIWYLPWPKLMEVVQGEGSQYLKHQNDFL